MTNSQINNNNSINTVVSEIKLDKEEFPRLQAERIKKEFIKPIFTEILNLIKNNKNKSEFRINKDINLIKIRIDFETKTIKFTPDNKKNLDSENDNIYYEIEKLLDTNFLKDYIVNKIKLFNVIAFKLNGKAKKFFLDIDDYCKNEQFVKEDRKSYTKNYINNDGINKIKKYCEQRLQEIENLKNRNTENIIELNKFNKEIELIKQNFIDPLLKNILSAIENKNDVFEFYPEKNNKAVKGKINYQTNEIQFTIGGYDIWAKELNFKFNKKYDILNEESLENYIYNMALGANIYISAKKIDEHLFELTNSISKDTINTIKNYFNLNMTEINKALAKNNNSEITIKDSCEIKSYFKPIL
jgi:hypothetical protein